MSINIFLDDERFPDEVFWIDSNNYYPKSSAIAWDIVRCPLSFKHLVESNLGKIDWMSFDNDLGTEEEGRHLLKWMCELYIDADMVSKFPSKVIIHTMNNIAKEWMIQYLVNFCECTGALVAIVDE